MKKSLIDQYRAEFEELKRQVEAMRSLLRESGLLGSAMDTSEIDEFRQKLLTGFDKEKIVKTHSGENACHCCHYASLPNSSPLRVYDIAYLLVKNPDFQLPEPDWAAIEKDPVKKRNYRCLMLGKNGCLFGNNRPAVCLSFICEGAVKAVLNNVGELDFPQNYSHSNRPLGDVVFKAIGLPRNFRRLGSVVSDWFYKVLLPKTGKSEAEIRGDLGY